MYIIVNEFNTIKAHGDSPRDCAAQVLKWYVLQGRLYVDGKVERYYIRKQDDSLNGLTDDEIYTEARKELQKIAVKRNYKFYKQI